MQKKIYYIIALLISCFNLTIACDSNEHGIVDLTLPEKQDSIVLDYPTTFTHPGILHTQDDITRWRNIVDAKTGSAYESYKLFAADDRSQATYLMNGPYKEIYRGSGDGLSNIQSKYENDFNAAYQNAVMYATTKEEAHAQKATAIIKAYANTLESIIYNDQPLLAGIMGVKFMYAAELVRYTYPVGMTDEEFEKVRAMFRNVFVPVLDTFMNTNAYSNGNWGASVGMSCIAAAILLDDLDMYKKAIDFYIYGNDNGTIRNYIDGETGQCQESGRDQAHAQLGIASLSVTCEIAYKQGTDLYGVLEDRLQNGFEYTAKYNLGYDDVPFKTWKDVTGKYSNWNTVSADKRGEFRPIYEMPYNHYVNRKGKEMPYTKMVLERTGPEGYYYEHFGFGTFLFGK